MGCSAPFHDASCRTHDRSLAKPVISLKSRTPSSRNPRPRATLPGYFGIRSEADSTLKNFLNWWAEWNNLLGHNEKRMKEAMLKYSGISEIPDTVSFSP